jgi:uncharacterized protein YggE
MENGLGENSIPMQSVINAMEKLGVPKDDIETSYFGIYPIRDYEKLEPRDVQVSATIEWSTNVSNRDCAYSLEKKRD